MNGDDLKQNAESKVEAKVQEVTGRHGWRMLQL